MTFKRVTDLRSSATDQVRKGNAGKSPEKPMDAVIIGAGPSGMVCLRNLLRNDPPLSVLAVDRQERAGGIWTGHIPAYSTLQDLKIEYQVHGVKFPQAEPPRRAPRDQVAEFCQAYHDEFGLGDRVLWQHEVVHVKMIEPMLHAVEIKCCSEGLATSESLIVFTRSVLVCTGDNFYKYTATFPGQETATFPIKHNLDIREASEIPDSDVVIIGAGPSAMDMVQEACMTRGATNVYLVSRSSHWGAPDGWWPCIWQFGFSELHILRILYRLLPIFVVDTIAFYVNVLWAYVYRIPEWMPPEKYPTSAKNGYILRTHLVGPYKKGQFKIRIAAIKSIQGDRINLTDGTVLHPKLLVAATGWKNDFSFLPGGQSPASEYKSFTSAARIRRPFYLRFYDQYHPGIFYISIANGFMAATEGASYLSQCVEQILRGSWVPPDEREMEENIRDVVLHHIALPGRLQTDLEESGFKNLRTKNER